MHEIGVTIENPINKFFKVSWIALWWRLDRCRDNEFIHDPPLAGRQGLDLLDDFLGAHG